VESLKRYSFARRGDLRRGRQEASKTGRGFAAVICYQVSVAKKNAALAQFTEIANDLKR
jgi:hypothetical protein